jgi:DNA-binding transcriptional ArsR family regulator
MTRSEHRFTSHSGEASEPEPTATERAVDTDELLALLGDEFTRDILSTLGDESLPAREIADRAAISRPTVYRRLNRLEDAGVVETNMEIHLDGKHRKQFQIVLDEVAVSLVGDLAVVDIVGEPSPTRDSSSSRLTSVSD